MYSNDDYASDRSAFRHWQRSRRDSTPIEYWDYLDNSEEAFVNEEEETEEAPE